MTRRMLVLSLLALGMSQSNALAACPSGIADELLCEDFNTYCIGGGHPGDPDCASGATKDSNLMLDVWQQTSGCGVSAMVEDSIHAGDPTAYFVSSPFAASYPGRKGQLLAQHTFRDWVSPNPNNLSRIIESKWPGGGYDSLVGRDDHPLVLDFNVTASLAIENKQSGRIFYSNGFIELAKGDPSDPLNRANMDFVWSPDCYGYCSPYIDQGPFPIICAQGNPETAIPAACPSVVTYPPPLHRSIAIGVLGMMDNDPCHCGSGAAHGGTNYHPVLFDGKVWWMLRSNTPRSSTASTVTPLNGAPMPPPGDWNGQLTRPDKFTWWHDPLDPATNNTAGYGPSAFNRLTLTIRATTVKIELRRIVTSIAGYEYEVYSVMDNIPMAYTGPFDTIRMGVSPGCELTSSTSWTSCAATRGCLDSNANQSRFVAYDEVLLYGGAPYRTSGACCMPNGTCVDDLLESECAALSGGVFRGENTACGQDDAICKGACCRTTSCEDDARINECAGGNYRGYGTTCAQGCPCVGHFGDIDADGDVDQSDFAVLQACVGGPGATIGGVCKCFDRDPTVAGDGDVDGEDVAEFELCASGPGIPLNPACDGR